MRQLRPEAQQAVDAVKGDLEARRAVKDANAHLATRDMGRIEAAISALFIPKCPWCGVAGTFDFYECMSIRCSN